MGQRPRWTLCPPHMPAHPLWGPPCWMTGGLDLTSESFIRDPLIFVSLTSNLQIADLLSLTMLYCCFYRVWGPICI